MKTLLLLSILLVGCAAPTSRISFTDGAKTLSLSLPKEMEASNLEFLIDAKNGLVTLKASRIESHSEKIIVAQGNREESNLKAAPKVVDAVASGVTSGVISGAMKGVIP